MHVWAEEGWGWAVKPGPVFPPGDSVAEPLREPGPAGKSSLTSSKLVTRNSTSRSPRPPSCVHAEQQPRTPVLITARNCPEYVARRATSFSWPPYEAASAPVSRWGTRSSRRLQVRVPGGVGIPSWVRSPGPGCGVRLSSFPWQGEGSQKALDTEMDPARPHGQGWCRRARERPLGGWKHAHVP